MAKELVLDANYVIGEKYILKNHMSGFGTVADAKESHDQQVTVLAGEYTIFSISNGMINVSKIEGKSGFWINPE